MMSMFSNLPVIGGKVFDGQFHDGILQFRMEDSAAQIVVRFGGDEIAQIGDWADGYHVQIEIVSAVLVQRQKSEAVAEMRHVERSVPPAVAVVPILERSCGHVIVQIETD